MLRLDAGMAGEEQAAARSLAGRAAAGSAEAFAELVELYAGRLVRYLRGMGVPSHDADDLVQESFIRAYDALDRYDPRYAFSTWLYTIARRLACNFFRDRRDHAALPEAGLPAADEGTDEPDPLPDTWGLAQRLLQPRYYEALWLFYGEDLSMKELADVMQITVTNAKVLVHRARQQLAQHLGAQLKDEEGEP